MSERPLQQNNEIILFVDGMLNLEAMHAVRQNDTFRDTFYSGKQTVTLTHSTESPDRYEFRVVNRDMDMHYFLSHKVFEVTIQNDDEANYAELKVYKELNEVHKAGDLAEAWADLHRDTGLGVPLDLDRQQFESIFVDYCDYLAEQERQKHGEA